MFLRCYVPSPLCTHVSFLRSYVLRCFFCALMSLFVAKMPTTTLIKKLKIKSVSVGPLQLDFGHLHTEICSQALHYFGDPLGKHAENYSRATNHKRLVVECLPGNMLNLTLNSEQAVLNNKVSEICFVFKIIFSVYRAIKIKSSKLKHKMTNCRILKANLS